MKAQIVKAEEKHIPYIADHVRYADRQELWDLAVVRPKEALEIALASSALCFTGLINDIPVAMFGVCSASLLSDAGIPWMIATSDLDRYPITFLRRNKQIISVMLAAYSRLENYVEASNTRSIKWLKTLGFAFGEPEPKGAFKKPFIKFWMERTSCLI